MYKRQVPPLVMTIHLLGQALLERVISMAMALKILLSVRQIMILTMAVADQAKLTLFLVVRTCRPFHCRILRTAQAMDSLLMAPRPETILETIFPLSVTSMATA